MNPFGQEAFAFQAGDDIASLIARAAAAEQSHASLSSLLSQHEENRNVDLQQDSLNFLPFSSMWDADFAAAAQLSNTIPSPLQQQPPQQVQQPAPQLLRNYATAFNSSFLTPTYNTATTSLPNNHFASLIGRSIQAKVENICDVGLVVSVEGLNPNGIKGILIFTASNPPPQQQPAQQIPQPIPTPMAAPSPIVPQTTLSTPTFTTIPQQPIQQHVQEEILIEPSSYPQRQIIPTVQPARVEQTDAESQSEQNLKGAGGVKKKYSKKEGKKRKYVKSGLYRKDKQGNFIFSSSDRARLAAMITSDAPEGAENASSSTQPPKTTVVVDTTATQKEETNEMINAFAVFCREQRPAIAQQHSELSKEKLQFILSEQWKALPEAEKQKYNEQAEKELKAPSMPSNDFSASQRVKRPLNAYNIFCKLHFDEVKKEYPHLSINELSRLMGEKWKKLPEDDKKQYYDKVEHVPRYKKPLNSYNLFCKQYFETLKKIHPDKSINVLSKIIAEKWKTLPQEEKKKFYEEAERQKNAFASNKPSGSEDAQRVLEGEDDADSIFANFKFENEDLVAEVQNQLSFTPSFL